MTAGVEWAAFVPVAVGISALPGASQMLGLAHAYRRGVLPAMLAVLGRLVSFLGMTVLVALGVGAVLARSGAVFTAVRWVGVAYLAYLGGQAVRAARRVRAPEAAGHPDRAPVRTWAMVREEFLVATTNPKAILLFAALLPQFVDARGPVTSGLLAVGVGYLGVEAVVALGYCLVGSRLRRSLGAGPEGDRRVRLATGVCLLAFAVYLGLMARPGH